ncbi:MAG: hypothetical protein DCC75_11995 [Proteobacteria bacterium]|nr:MAG: hypothetical protein DCC75_11995 [Pseudomonadota bacterium]
MFKQERSMNLGELTWREAESAFPAYPFVLVPIGAALKEHGGHLPLDTDLIIANRLTQAIADKMVLLYAPAVPYGYYPAFVDYAGSVNVALDTFKSYLRDLCHSFARHGMRKIYFLNTGLSTNWALEPLRLELQEESIVMEYTDLMEMLAPLERQFCKQQRGSHADESETSIMLYLEPSRVRMDLAEKDDEPRRGPGPFSRDPKIASGIYSRTGAWGDPSLATAEKGQLLFEGLVEAIIEFLARFAEPGYKPLPARGRYLGGGGK